MARIRYRAGTYRVIEQGTGESELRIDNELFFVPKDGTLEFNSNNYWSYDSSINIKVYRTPSNPVTITQSVGGDKKLNPSGNMNTKSPIVKK